MNARKRLRAIAALTMLIASAISLLEPIAGQARDTAEHYGDVVAASDHSVGATDVAQADSAEEGQHIKGFDHCAHVHGSAVSPALLFPSTLLSVRMLREPPVSMTHPDVLPSRPYHPPKA